MMTARRSWSRQRPTQPETGDEQGQALAIVVAVIALLALLPVGVQVLATGQAPLTGQNVDRQQALQAARAGLSDYVNHIQTVSGYLSFCSSGQFSSCATGADPNNPGFANKFGDANWATVDGGAAFQYVVDTAGLNLSFPNNTPQDLSVYVTGRAGSSGHYVYATTKTELQVTPLRWEQQYAGVCTSSGTSLQFTVPQVASYAQIQLFGGEGGANNGFTGTGGGSDGAEETAWVRVTGGNTWTADPGSAGAGGGGQLLGILAGGGAGGCGSFDLNGGAGGNGGLISLVDDYGGGGGAGTLLCLGTEKQCYKMSTPSLCTSMVASAAAPCVIAVAGGGGGQGGDTTTMGSYSSGETNVGGNSSTQGADGQWAGALLSAGCGTGGGGGGGFTDGGSGGADSGVILGVACVAGAGYGGNAGASSVTSLQLSSSGCPAPTTTGASAPDAGPNGEVIITFYGGTVCPATPVPLVSASALLTRQMNANTTN